MRKNEKFGFNRRQKKKGKRKSSPVSGRVQTGSGNEFFAVEVFPFGDAAFFRFFNNCEFPAGLRAGPGLFIGHPYCITINPDVVIGSHCNIHKGVTIGQENRGKRKGTPKIGNNVWIGVNATVVGNIVIGDDVMIAPNSFVNCDVPPHSIVMGNPCVIKHRDNATEAYL